MLKSEFHLLESPFKISFVFLSIEIVFAFFILFIWIRWAYVVQFQSIRKRTTIYWTVLKSIFRMFMLLFSIFCSNMIKRSFFSSKKRFFIQIIIFTWIFSKVLVFFEMHKKFMLYNDHWSRSIFVEPIVSWNLKLWFEKENSKKQSLNMNMSSGNFRSLLKAKTSECSTINATVFYSGQKTTDFNTLNIQFFEMA